MMLMFKAAQFTRHFDSSIYTQISMYYSEKKKSEEIFFFFPGPISFLCINIDFSYFFLVVSEILTLCVQLRIMAC